AALHVGVFDALSGGSVTAGDVAGATSIQVEAALRLLGALTALGLVTATAEAVPRYKNSVVAEAFLVRGAACDFRDRLTGDPLDGLAGEDWGAAA
ncbi:MAG: methyltransferase dimerization domain-containing protein, partial [Pseudomonadota bacterium]